MSKTIIVTGGTSAYGRAIIQKLADEGHGVVAIMDPIDETNIAAAKELQQIDNVELVEMDIKDDESVKTGFSFILRRYGHIDVLINNECPVKLGLIETMAVDYCQEVFNANAWGALRAFKAVVPTMRKNKGGLLINVNSGVNYFAIPFIAALIIAKAGLEILTDGILREVRQFGIEGVSLWTGFYPVEFVPDPEKTAQEDNYGPLYEEKAKLESALAERDRHGKVNAQAVAGLVSEIVNMPAGKRPPRFCLNPGLDQAELQFIKGKELAAEGWQHTYS